MRQMLKAGYLWQFAGGFAIGAVALVSLHAAAAPRPAVPPPAISASR